MQGLIHGGARDPVGTGVLPGAARLARLRAAMAEVDLDALVAASPANVLYLTGFALGMESLALFAGGHPLLAVLLRASERPLLIAPITDAAPAIVRRSPACHLPYGRNFVNLPEELHGLSPEEAAVARFLAASAPAPDAVQALASALAKAGAHRVGIDEAGAPASLHRALAAAVCGAELVPASALLRRARAVKEPEEIACLRRGAEIVEAAMQEVWRHARPGVSEAELARVAVCTMVDAGARPTLWYVGVGTASALVDRPPTARAVAPGDLVMLDLGCEYGGYYADLARTAVVGAPGARLARCYAAVQAGERAAIAMVGPGRTGAEIYRAAVEAARASGIPHFDRRHCGHGIGLEPYDEPTVAPAAAEALQPGMVLNIETPYYEIGFGGLQLEDTVVVTESGAAYLSRASRDLLVL